MTPDGEGDDAGDGDVPSLVDDIAEYAYQHRRWVLDKRPKGRELPPVPVIDGKPLFVFTHLTTVTGLRPGEYDDMPADAWALHFAVVEAAQAGTDRADEERRLVESGRLQPGTPEDRAAARWAGFDEDVAAATASETAE